MLLIISDHNDSLPSPSYYSYHQPYSVFGFFYLSVLLLSDIHDVTAPFSSTVDCTVSLHWGHCVSISEQGFALHNLLPQFGQVMYILMFVIIALSYLPYIARVRFAEHLCGVGTSLTNARYVLCLISILPNGAVCSKVNFQQSPLILVASKRVF